MTTSIPINNATRMRFKRFQHKRIPLLYLFITVLIVVLGLSCNTTNSNKVKFEDGISLEIKELLGDELLGVLVNELDFPINRGENPPNVEAVLLASGSLPTEATVVMKPTILVKTNVPKDHIQPGDKFADTRFRFGNQNMKKYTVNFDRIILGEKPFIGTGSFIIGEGDKFSVFGKQEQIVEQDTVISVNFLSGTVEDGGISDIVGGIIVVENHDIGIFIPNGTGRSFEDGDGFASLDEWPVPAKIKATNDSLIIQ